MFVTYISASNTATNGTALGNSDSNSDVVIKKIIVGAPVSAGNIFVYNITNPLNASTVNIAAKHTLPTFSTTNINPGSYIFDYTSAYCRGLQLSGGGNVIIDQTMQVTVIWDYADNSDQ